MVYGVESRQKQCAPSLVLLEMNIQQTKGGHAWSYSFCMPLTRDHRDYLRVGIVEHVWMAMERTHQIMVQEKKLY